MKMGALDRFFRLTWVSSAIFLHIFCSTDPDGNSGSSVSCSTNPSFVILSENINFIQLIKINIIFMLIYKNFTQVKLKTSFVKIFCFFGFIIRSMFTIPTGFGSSGSSGCNFWKLWKWKCPVLTRNKMSTGHYFSSAENSIFLIPGNLSKTYNLNRKINYFENIRGLLYKCGIKFSAYGKQVQIRLLFFLIIFNLNLLIRN